MAETETDRLGYLIEKIIRMERDTYQNRGFIKSVYVRINKLETKMTRWERFGNHTGPLVERIEQLERAIVDWGVEIAGICEGDSLESRIEDQVSRKVITDILDRVKMGG